MFLEHLEDNGIAILNNKINGITSLAKRLIKKKIRIITYGTQKSDIHIFNKKNKLYLKIYDKIHNLKMLNYKNFELENLSCSICCCIGIGLKNKDILKSISKIKKLRADFKK